MRIFKSSRTAVAAAAAVLLGCHHRSVIPAASVRDGFVTADDGAKLYYRIIGGGPDTLLAPPAAYLAEDLGPLLAKHLIVTYDPRSRGASEMLDTTRLGFFKDVEDMEAVRRGLRLEHVAVLGWSYLGGVAATYVALHPEHVTRLIQIGPMTPRAGSNFMDPRRRIIQRDTAAIRRLRGTAASLRTASDSVAFCRLDMRARLLPPYMADTANIARMKSDPCAWQNENPERWLRAVRLSLAALGNAYDLRPRAVAVQVPVLVIWGDADPGPEAAAQEWTISFPNARMLTIPSAGHLPHLEQPKIFFEAVDRFLTSEWPKDARRPAGNIGPSG
jgi:proline iminopeptidase